MTIAMLLLALSLMLAVLFGGVLVWPVAVRVGRRQGRSEVAEVMRAGMREFGAALSEFEPQVAARR